MTQTIDPPFSPRCRTHQPSASAPAGYVFAAILCALGIATAVVELLALFGA